MRPYLAVRVSKGRKDFQAIPRPSRRTRRSMKHRDHQLLWRAEQTELRKMETDLRFEYETYENEPYSIEEWYEDWQQVLEFEAMARDIDRMMYARMDAEDLKRDQEISMQQNRCSCGQIDCGYVYDDPEWLYDPYPYEEEA